MKSKILSRFGWIMMAMLPASAGYGDGTETPASKPPVATPATAPAAIPSTGPSAPAPSPAANIEEIIKLSKAGARESVVLACVNKTRLPYQLSTEQIIQLINAGVSSSVITGMLEHDSAIKHPDLPMLATDYSKSGERVRRANAQGESARTARQVETQPQPPPAAEMVATPLPDHQVQYVPVYPGPDYYYWAPGYLGWDNRLPWFGGGWNSRGGYYGGWNGFRDRDAFRGGNGSRRDGRGGGESHGGGRR